MLSSRAAALISATAAAAASIVMAPSAHADSAGCVQTPVGVVCSAHKPGGKSSHGPSKPSAHGPSTPDPCTYRRYTASVPKSDPAWGKSNGGGGLTVQSCAGKQDSFGSVQQGNGTGNLLAPAAPAHPAGPPPPTDAELAQSAQSKLNLPAPVVNTAPGTGKLALVGLPVWVWLSGGDAGAKPLTTEAKVSSVSVSATATVSSLTYSMGDGTTITCKGAGTPYKASYGDKPSPDCGHTYSTTSANEPGGRFTIRAEASWHVHWTSSDDREGDFDVTPGAGVATLRVGEVQVVNRADGG